MTKPLGMITPAATGVRRLAIFAVVLLLAAACGGTQLEVASEPAPTEAPPVTRDTTTTTTPGAPETTTTATPAPETTTTETPVDTTTTAASTPSDSLRAPEDNIEITAGSGPGVPVGLEIGDCQENGIDDVNVAFVPAKSVDCSTPHLSEIVAIYTLGDGDFPGQEPAGRVSGQACEEGFERSFGIEYRRTPQTVGPVYPTEGSWADGDRAVLCLASFDEPVSMPLREFPADEMELPAGQIYSFFMTVGDCLDEDQDILDTFVTVIDCDEPHSFEVYATIRLIGGEFPGDNELEAIADELCAEDFVRYTGTDLADSDLGFTTLTPTEEGWNDFDDFTVVCVIQAPAPVSGSSQG